MIVVDSSAVVGMMLDEPEAALLSRRLEAEPLGERLMSTANYVEAGAVLAGRAEGPPQQAQDHLDAFLARVGIDLAPVSEAQARIALEARVRYGRGFGAAAKLNYGDCFAYALAMNLSAPLLFVGEDFGRTDVTVAL